MSEQLTLGKLIELLQRCKSTSIVRFDFCGFIPRDVDSYRGYYEQLAVGFDDDWGKDTTVEALVKELQSAVGSTFEGYKGGKYRMGATTPMWVSRYGEAHSTAITGVLDDGYMVILTTAYQP